MFTKPSKQEGGTPSASSTPSPKSPTPEGPKASGIAGNKKPLQPSENASPITPKPKSAPSIISSDMDIKGNLKSQGDLQVEGKIRGDVMANNLVVGEPAKIHGEISADDITIYGSVSGCVRGLKVRLMETARVDGDVIHKAISIETGAHFEGTVQRADDPYSHKKDTKKTDGSKSS